MIGVAIAIKLDSRGPVFFRQERVGRDGQRFKLLKFRSMVAGAEAQKAALMAHNQTDGLFKMADDPRITRVGKVLRKTALDELPQLINVLMGRDEPRRDRARSSSTRTRRSSAGTGGVCISRPG